MSRAKRWWIASPVGILVLGAVVLGLVTAQILELADSGFFDDFSPEAKLAIGIPTAIVLGWFAMLAVCAIPRLLGHWVGAQLVGQRLAWFTVWPLYFATSQDRRTILKWTQPFFRSPRTWHPVGEFDPVGLDRVIWSGIAAQLLVAIGLLIASAVTQEAAWHGVLQLLAGVAMCGLIFSVGWDAAILRRLKNEPMGVAGENAVIQIRDLRAAGVPRAQWPKDLIPFAVEHASTITTRAELHVGLLQDATQVRDRESAMILVENALKEASTWPSRTVARVQIGLMAAQILAALLARPDKARSVLPSAELARSSRDYRELIMVLILAREDRLSEARDGLRSLQKRKGIYTRKSRARKIESLRVTSLFLDRLEARSPAEVAIGTYWSQWIRARNWDRAFVEQLAVGQSDKDRWSFATMARLVYWFDAGNVKEARRVAEEIQTRPDIDELHATVRRRLWSEAAMFYALMVHELEPARAALERAEATESTEVRALLAAQAAVLTLDGQPQEAMIRLDELNELLNSLPEWAARNDDESDRIAAIRKLASPQA